MSKALYRKYRPRKLAEVVGQEAVTKPLTQALKQGKISHAYLFAGPRGTGKTSVARIFAHEINGFPYELEDDYVDIIEIDGASNRGIDDIRELREKVAIAPSEGKYKVYIIDEVHMLTPPAFNALLKTLEEPPAHVVFLMATTDVQKVPTTILSRVQMFTFQLAEPPVMQKFLRQVATAENIQIDDDALALVVERGGGSFRDSLSLLDQISTLSEQKITRDLVLAALGLPEEEEVAQLLTAYAGGDLAVIAQALRQLLAAGRKPELLAEAMIRRIVAEPRTEWLGLLARLPDVAAPFPEAKLLVALTAEVEPGGSNAQIFSGTGAPLATESPRYARGRGRDPSQPAIVPEKTERSAAPASRPQDSGTEFDWGEFKVKVQEQNDAVAQQLEKTTPEVKDGVLNLYPSRKIVGTILAKANNLAILRRLAGGLAVEIHEADEKPPQQSGDQEFDAKLAKISDIMGGEVVEDGGGNPF